MTRAVELRIDELVLDGFERLDRETLTAALRNELAQPLRGGPASAGPVATAVAAAIQTEVTRWAP